MVTGGGGGGGVAGLDSGDRFGDSFIAASHLKHVARSFKVQIVLASHTTGLIFTNAGQQAVQLQVNVAAEFSADKHINNRIQQTVYISQRMRDDLDDVHGVAVGKGRVKAALPNVDHMNGQPGGGERDRHGGDQKQQLGLLFLEQHTVLVAVVVCRAGGEVPAVSGRVKQRVLFGYLLKRCFLGSICGERSGELSILVGLVVVHEGLAAGPLGNLDYHPHVAEYDGQQRQAV